MHIDARCGRFARSSRGRSSQRGAVSVTDAGATSATASGSVAGIRSISSITVGCGVCITGSGMEVAACSCATGGDTGTGGTEVMGVTTGASTRVAGAVAAGAGAIDGASTTSLTLRASQVRQANTTKMTAFSSNASNNQRGQRGGVDLGTLASGQYPAHAQSGVLDRIFSALPECMTCAPQFSVTVSRGPPDAGSAEFK